MSEANIERMRKFALVILALTYILSLLAVLTNGHSFSDKCWALCGIHGVLFFFSLITLSD